MVLQGLDLSDMLDWAATLSHAIALASGGQYVLDYEAQKAQTELELQAALDSVNPDMDEASTAVLGQLHEALLAEDPEMLGAALDLSHNTPGVREYIGVMLYFRGLLLYTVVVIFPIDCCITKPRSSSIILYNKNNTSIAQRHHTNNNPSFNFPPLNQQSTDTGTGIRTRVRILLPGSYRSYVRGAAPPGRRSYCATGHSSARLGAATSAVRGSRHARGNARIRCWGW